MSALRRMAHAIGVGRAERTNYPRRPDDHYLFRSLVLKRWPSRMRFGWVLAWNGPYWVNAIGIAGPDWNGGNWLGGGSWCKHGSFVVCRYRRRGSWRSDRAFARAMAASEPDR